jgi:hypothetical protein
MTKPRTPHSDRKPSAPTAALPAPLSPHWAFVVQLRQGTPLTPTGMQGRVEHLSSGKATTFRSLAELRAFMERIVAELLIEKPP